jgi:hypothetical protein
MKAVTLGAITLTWLLLAITPLAAGDSDEERQTLVGLKGVRVVVENINPNAEKDGLSLVLLQTDVELKLRQAGIPVLTGEETFRAPGSPFLYLVVSASS